MHPPKKNKSGSLLWLGRIFFSFLFLLSCSKKNGTGNGDHNGSDTNPAPLNAEVTIQAADNKQLIQGFGCATVFTPPGTSPYSAEEFDRLFGTGSGQVGLSILRIRVATDDAWRSVELNHAKWAVQRGARVIASPWSPPASMKTNGSLTGGSLKTDSSAAYAAYLNSFAGYMAANGAPVYALSVQNEPDISVSYESCDWTADAMRVFIRDHGHMITNCLLMAPESFNNNQVFVNSLLSDAGALANLDIVGGHIYGGGVVENTLAKSLNREVWMTEHLDTNYHHSAAIATAAEIHDCLSRAGFSAYIWWYGKRFYGPLGQDGQITKRGHVMAQFARFIRPGAVRLGAGTSTRPEVLVSAYRNGSKKVIVAVNTGAYSVRQEFRVQGAAAGSWIPYLTTALKNTEPGTPQNTVNDSFSYVLPPGSVTTFVEQ